MNKEAQQLALLEAQLTGFAHAKNGYSIESLIDAAGVTLKEWEKLLDQYDIYQISKDEAESIREHLKKECSHEITANH